MHLQFTKLKKSVDKFWKQNIWIIFERFMYLYKYIYHKLSKAYDRLNWVCMCSRCDQWTSCICACPSSYVGCIKLRARAWIASPMHDYLSLSDRKMNTTTYKQTQMRENRRDTCLMYSSTSHVMCCFRHNNWGMGKVKRNIGLITNCPYRKW